MAVLAWRCLWCKSPGYFPTLPPNDAILFDAHRDLPFYFPVFVESDECYAIFVSFVLLPGGVLPIRVGPTALLILGAPWFHA